MKPCTIAAALLAVALPVASCLATADTQVSGVIDNAGASDGLRHEQFTCSGMPTCVGIHTVTARPNVCSNSAAFTGNVTFTGLDLSRPGSFSGTEILADRIFFTRNNDGTCTYTLGPGATWSFTASWDGANGTIDVMAIPPDNVPRAEHGTFTASVASSAPVFPMSVTADITPTSANASALVQPRPQDVGQTASIFVFAQVPASLIAAPKRATPGPRAGAHPLDGDVCVLAQLGADGRLTAVSGSSMAPYLTGVLSSQAQSVAILSNASTPSLAGATFFVGYGSTAGSMLSNGIYQAAVVIPGSPQCAASLSAAPAADAPGALSGLWWNPAESGWGIDFTQRGNVVFAAWYTYDSAGNPKWYVASDCVLASGTCNGTLYEVHGPVFFSGNGFDPTRVQPQTAGTLQVRFADASNASMSYTVGNQSRTVAITRQVFQSGTTPAVDFTDLWWNPNESGWGIAISHQSGVMFLAWFVYDGNGNPLWLVASDCVVSGSACTGTLYQTTGPAFAATFDPSLVHATAVGTATVDFSDANNATLSYTVNGTTSSKRITRQRF